MAWAPTAPTQEPGVLPRAPMLTLARITRVRTCMHTQLSYLDLYLVHAPSSGAPGPQVTPPLIDTWRAMEELADKVGGWEKGDGGQGCQGWQVLPAHRSAPQHLWGGADAGVHLPFARVVPSRFRGDGKGNAATAGSSMLNS